MRQQKAGRQKNEWQKNRRRPPEEGQNYFGKKMGGKKMEERASRKGREVVAER
jgi:hypothetical protein